MEQLTLILNLQWLLFKNSLRSEASKLELIARIVSVVFGAIIDIVIGISLYIGTLVLSNNPNANIYFLILFCIITLYWQLIPILTTSFGNGLNISNFRLYPISDKKLLLLDLISVATSITSLSIYLPLLGVFIASIIKSPLYTPVITLLFALFILFNIGLSCYLQKFLEGVLAHRRAKEIGVFIILAILIGFSFVPMIMFRQELKETQRKQVSPKGQITSVSPNKNFSLKEILPSTQHIVQTLNWTPPGLVARTTLGLAKESTTNQIAIVFLSTLFSGLTLLLVQRKIKYEFYGVASKYVASDKAIVVKDKPIVNREFSGSIFDNKLFNLLPLHAVMVLEKELRYFYRSSKIILIFISGSVGAISFAFLLQVQKPTESSSIFSHFVMPGLNFYSLLVLGQFFTNSFGFDSHGVKAFFLMPVQGRNVLLGKNLAMSLITLLQTAVTLTLFNYAIYPVSGYILLNTLFCTAIGYLGYVILGNFISVLYPQKMEFSTLSNNNYSKMAQLLMFLIQGVLFSILIIGPAIAWYSKISWITYPIFTIELIVMLVIYKISLNYAGSFFEKRAEQFLQALL